MTQRVKILAYQVMTAQNAYVGEFAELGCTIAAVETPDICSSRRNQKQEEMFSVPALSRDRSRVSTEQIEVFFAAP